MTQLGKYDILEELGRGGFGIVYKARDISLDRMVALKVLHPQLTVDTSFLERFRKEARSLARINHPNVVTIHEVGEVAGKVYIAMEYLPGGSLSDKLKEEPFSPEEALKVTSEVAAGLGAGHEKGLIHRDVKPENILFNERQEAVIADFGLAKALWKTSSYIKNSLRKAVGTPYYCAPELWNGKPQPSPATDVYSIGCVLFEMVTGEVLFQGDTEAELITKHLLKDALVLMDACQVQVPARIQPVLEKCLAKDPSQRYQSMGAFMKALKQSQEKGPVNLKAAPQKTPDQVVKPTTAQEKPIRIEKPSSQRSDEARISKPARKEQAVEKEKATATGVEKPDPPIWLVWGAIGLVAVILIGIWIVSLGGGNRPVQEAPAEEGNLVLAQMTNRLDGAEMVYVPTGDFLMGSEDSDADDDEDPEHTIYLDAYWIYKHEVTNAQFAAFLNDMGNQKTGGMPWLDADDPDALIHQSGGEWVADSRFRDHPVVEVSWYVAQAYCEWAGGRLPTEAEWEKAARGKDGQTYPWGEDDPTCSLAQFSNCSGATVPVGSFPNGASPYGALDMAGNVWEWVGDWYDYDYYASSWVSNPTGPVSGDYRVLRSGSWGDSGGDLRASNRLRSDPDSTTNSLGFRCFRSLEP